MTREEIQAQIDALESNILKNKAYLSQTDYIVTRATEQGETLDAAFKAERETARRQVSLDQEAIVILKAQMTELEPERPEPVNE